jgi:hypothetical protein
LGFPTFGELEGFLEFWKIYASVTSIENTIEDKDY